MLLFLCYNEVGDIMQDLKLLKIFKVVAEEENMTHASERLFIAQPAITRYIKELEKELNVELFQRTNKGLKLTEEGSKLYKKIKGPIDELDNVDMDLDKSIKIGSHFTFYSKLFGEKISKIYKEIPSITVDLINKEISDMIIDLKNKKIDIVLSKKIDDIDDDIDYIRVGEVHDIIIGGKDSNEEISLDELKDSLLCMPGKTTVSYNNFFKKINISESEFKNIKNISYNTMVIMINNLNGYGLVTEEYFKEDLDKGIIKKININTDLITEYGIYYNKNNKSELIKKVIDYLK